MERKFVIALLVVVAVGAAMYGLLYPYISSGVKAKKRQAVLTDRRADRRSGGGGDAAKRRKAISDSLKDVGVKKGRGTLEERLAQAGIGVSPNVFYVCAISCGSLIFLILFFLVGQFLGAVVGAFAGLMLPFMIVSFQGKRRIRKFVEVFPDALDVVIRGVKAGLPVGDCLRVIAGEGQEPVRSEFRRIVEAQSVGMTVTEAVERFAERVPVPETAFFAIVISIQQKSGGNLSEALSNLSRVLRDRKKLKGKVKAMSAEAKASAGIIGALPFLVGGGVSILNPSYMSLLYTTTLGQICLVGSLIWMSFGVLVMWKMIDFDF